MMFKTHLFLGFLIGLFVAPYIPIKSKFLFLIITTVASSFPDIDHANSKISNKFFLFKIISFFFRHRGITHSLFTAAALSAVVYNFISADVAYAIFVGFFAHIIGDALTMNGIEPFYPIKLKISGFIRTGGFLEKICFYAILGAVVFKIAAAI